MMVPWRARIPRVMDWPRPPKGSNGQPLPDAPNHDGDTVRLDLDRYDDDESRWDIRLLAVFTPEISPVAPGSVECRAELWRLLQQYEDGSKWPLWVDSVQASPMTYPSKLTKSFDRYVCLVSNAARTRVLNQEIAAFAAANGWVGGRGT